MKFHLPNGSWMLIGVLIVSLIVSMFSYSHIEGFQEGMNPDKAEKLNLIVNSKAPLGEKINKLKTLAINDPEYAEIDSITKSYSDIELKLTALAGKVKKELSATKATTPPPQKTPVKSSTNAAGDVKPPPPAKNTPSQGPVIPTNNPGPKSPPSPPKNAAIPQNPSNNTRNAMPPPGGQNPFARQGIKR